jgi:hypothetical protein
MAWRVAMPNQFSIWLIQELPTGVKCKVTLGCLASQTSALWWVDRLSRTTWISRALGYLRATSFMNLVNSMLRPLSKHRPMTRFGPPDTATAVSRSPTLGPPQPRLNGRGALSPGEARRVRRVACGNGPGAIPIPRPRPTQPLPGRWGSHFLNFHDGGWLRVTTPSSTRK